MPLTKRAEHRFNICEAVSKRFLQQRVWLKACRAGTMQRVPLISTDNGVLSGTGGVGDWTLFPSGYMSFRSDIGSGYFDFYWVTDRGYAGVIKNVQPGATSDVLVDLQRLQQHILIPFNAAESGANLVDTGIEFVNQVLLDPTGTSIITKTAEAAKTIAAGYQSTSGTNAPTKFSATKSVAAVGRQDSLLTAAEYASNVGATDALRAANAQRISYQLSAGSVSAAGLLQIVTILPEPLL